MAQRGPGRPRKNVETGSTVEVKEPKLQEAPAYRHMIAFISKQNIAVPERGIITALEASTLLNDQYEQFGYVVSKAFHIGDAGEGAVGVLYVLERQDVNN